MTDVEKEYAAQNPGPGPCAVCGKAAVCFGAYERAYGDDRPPERACGDCCAHGNEDGWCRPILSEELTEVTTDRYAENMQAHQLALSLGAKA